jgi:acid phosphatase family membrane protein YuiD
MESVFSNYLLAVGFAAWLITQFLKIGVAFAANKKVTLSLLWSSGGMPSSHASLVCALTVGAAKILGIGSPLFALVFFGSLIVIRDALGVRRQTGEHAKALNTLFCIISPTEDVTADNPNAEKMFCELIGHTPVQVLCGAILGALVGFFIPVC